MREEWITSRKNPLLVQIRRLASSRGARRSAGMFLGDGVKLLEEALKWGAPLETVVYSEGLDGPELPPEVRTVRVPEDVMASISPMESPQGALFLCRMWDTAPPPRLEGGRYLVLDGWTGLSGNNLATVLLYFDEESQQMLPAEQISTSELYNASLRNVSTLVSRDLDGDGIVEIPTQPDEAGLLNLSQSRRMDFIVWMDYTSPEPEKSFGLLDEESSCYIELPAEWEGNLMLTDSAEGEEAVELHTVDEGKLVLIMRLVPSSESAAGWTRLGVVASRQMQAKFGPDVVLKDQSYRLSRSLYRLNG